jgi:tellurite resistance protein TerC
MFAVVDIAWWHWVGFLACVAVFLAFDLGVFHRRARVVKVREALAWTALWVGLAMLFGLALGAVRGQKEALQFYTGYLIEFSLSMDNVFVIALIFNWLSVPLALQHRVLFWGILGAMLMRGLLIALGAVLIALLHWVLYLLGAFVLFTGLRMMFAKTRIDPQKNRVVLFARRLYPVTPGFEGQRFATRWHGRLALTPLALVLLTVETTDLIFAMDSVPAVFAVTTKPFIVFTSNVFAILGLRSLYFVLAGALGYFRYLKSGLSLVLVFIGTKMLLDPHDLPPRGIQIEIPTSVSLLVVAAIVLLSVLFSILAAHRDKTIERPALPRQQ